MRFNKIFLPLHYQSESLYMLKKNITTTVFLILSIVLLVSPFNQAFGQRLKGQIISYTDSYYSVREKFGKAIKGPKLNDSVFHDQYVVFDHIGNISECIEYNADGTVYCKFKGINGYDKNNLESIYVRIDPGIIIERKPFILESVKYNWGELYKMTYQNDINGHPVEETIFDLWGRVILKTTFKRDEKGNSIEEKFSDGTVDSYKYDNAGNKIEWTSRSSNSNIIVTTYKNNESGDIIEVNINNYFKSSFKFHYDVYTYKYVYDNQGNWIERTEYENGLPQRIIVKTIKYAL